MSPAVCLLRLLSKLRAAVLFRPRARLLRRAPAEFGLGAGTRLARMLLPVLLAAGCDSAPAQTYVFTTLASNLGTSSRLNQPCGLAIDRDGSVIVADTGNHAIRRISSNGLISTIAGVIGQRGNADGLGSVARFSRPTSVAVDSAGFIYIADSDNQTVRRITPEGVVTTVAGRANPFPSPMVDGAGSLALFAIPNGLAVDGNGVAFVTDVHTVRRVSQSGVVVTIAGMWEMPPYIFNHPVSSGNADGMGQAARFNLPSGLALDRQGNLIVADSNNHLIRRISPQGVVSTLAGTKNSPYGPGFPALPGSADGTGADARFNHPSGVAVDDSGNVFVADTYNHTIRRISPDGVVTTIGGAAGGPGGTSGSLQDGAGTTARFNRPYAIVVDAHGAIFVADSGNNVIRKGVPATSPQPSRLANLSTLGFVPENGQLTVGFTVRGGSGPLLLRAVGPTLERFGVWTPLALPRLEIAARDSGVSVGAIEAWGDDAGTSEATARIGAFALPGGSQDAALVRVFSASGYTAQISSRAAGRSGTALAEIYDLGDTNSAGRLKNISTLGLVGAGPVLTLGFVIAGEEPKRLLIRAVGPALAQFGILNALSDPLLAVRRPDDRIVAYNDTWNSNSPDLAAATAAAGAFTLPRGSRDAALVVSLSPGAYTVEVYGPDPRSGTALVEIYDLDP